MFRRIRIVGRGRVGSAIAGRLDSGGLAADTDPDLVLICVPDSAIVEVARSVATGPWVAHVSGATPLTALDPHARRFSLHPLQTFVRWRGPEQLDGAWAAVSFDDDDGRARGRWLAGTLGLRPFDLAEDRRPLYHAGAVMASNYLVTLHRAASRALERAGVPAEALTPLMLRTIENHFELTGPIARGDWATVESHLKALEAELPELLPLYRELARVTAP
jgi:predicted short-subunit dehydrogenase-like oxidoreductase (DUF2520 family)